MKSAFYTGATGLMANQHSMDTIGNNLANVNTSGYKPQTVSFSSLLYRDMYANNSTNSLTGNGVAAKDSGINPKQTALQPAGEYAFGIDGDGFFAVEKDGEILYTRDGNFTIGTDDDDRYLVTETGAYVLDDDYDPVELPRLKDSHKSRHKSRHKKRHEKPLVEQIAVYRFPNPEALSPAGGNCYRSTARSGRPKELDSEDYTLHQGYAEISAVDLTQEMTNMITAQRAYQVSARVIQMSDENEQTVNHLRK